LSEYNSEEESEKPSDKKSAVGGGNLDPEVLKMLQQMTPPTEVAKEEDEPDEIKVAQPPRVNRLLDLLCIKDAFAVDPVCRGTGSSQVSSYISIGRT